MRNFLAAFILLAVSASAAIVSSVNEYLPPLEQTVTFDPTKNVDLEGYHFISQIPDEISSEYLPLVTKTTTTVAKQKSVEEPKIIAVPNIYLPPTGEASTEATGELKYKEEPDSSTLLGENGYEYKVIRRLKYRHRRDVSEVVNDYLPPVEKATTRTLAELKLSVNDPESTAVWGENGYEYKTVRRLKYRQRPDVSELANDYLPPAEEVTTEAVGELKFEEEPSNTDVFGENGYKYKTVRLLNYRQSRNVSEVGHDYLPPAEEVKLVGAGELKSGEDPNKTAVLGKNGYEYKTVHRLKYSQRHDVTELANNYLSPVAESSTAGRDDYLLPAQKATTETFAELKSNEEPIESTFLGENGYEYKTIRQLKYRQRLF